MFRQFWFWAALIGLAFVGSSYSGQLFWFAVVFDGFCWLMGILLPVLADRARIAEQRRIAWEIKRGHLVQAIKIGRAAEERLANDVAEAEQKIKKLQEQKREIERRARGGDLVATSERLATVKHVIANLPLSDDDKETLSVSVDRRLLRELKRRIDGK